MACHPNLPSLAPHRRDPPPPVVSGQRMRQGRCWIRKFNVDAVIIDDDDDDDDDDDIAVTYLHRWWRVLTHVTVMYGISWEPSTATIRPVGWEESARSSTRETLCTDGTFDSNVWWSSLPLWRIWRKFSNTLIQNWPVKWERWNSSSSIKYAYCSRSREIYTVQFDLLRV